MTRKILTLLMALLLLIPFGAQAQQIDLDYEGIAFTIPDDFVTTLDEEGDTAQILIFIGESIPNTTYLVAIGTHQEHPVANLAEHDDAAMEALFQDLSGDLHEPAFAINTAGEHTYMVITEGTNCEVIYITLYEHTFISMSVLSTGDTTLTAEAIAALDAIAASLVTK